LLAPLDLEAIAQESRNCFLYEEAPDYLVILEQGIARLGNPKTMVNLDEQYQKLIRVAHSLKGGAGLAEMPALSQLSHKLEDLLIAIQEKRVSLHEQISSDRTSVKSEVTPDGFDRTTSAYQLLLMSLDRVSALLFEALNQPELPDETTPQMADPVCDAIDEFLASQGGAKSEELADLENVTPLDRHPQMSSFMKTSLEVDLEECLQRIESSLRENQASDSIFREATREASREATREATREALRSNIATFAEECTLLGDTLGVTWLSEIGSQLEQWSQETDISLQQVTGAIAQIRQQRHQALDGSETESLTSDEEENSAVSAESEWQSPEEFSDLDSDLDLPEPPPLSAEVPQRFLKYLIRQPENARSPENINLRVSLSRIDRMTDTVGELLINYEQLEQCEQQLKDAILGQNLLPKSANSANSTAAHNLKSSILLKTVSQINQQVDRNRIDMVLGARNLRMTLANMRSSLEQLYRDLTAARMVPFREMTERFFVLIDNLKQQYQKSVNLVVSGQDVLVDRWILEQLQTPLTHLLRNAFDHGIELPRERMIHGKSNQATIRLSAISHGSYVVISIADDGRGINPEKIYQKALEKGLISPDKKTWSAEEILQFLFTSGFSTAERVTDISGRGVGLDIVVQEVAKLGGSVAVKTTLGNGTEFTIAIPLTLSILPLHIFRCQGQTLAIPAANVLETIRLADSLAEVTGDRVSHSAENQSIIQWQNQFIPVFHLNQLLPIRSCCPSERSAGFRESGFALASADAESLRESANLSEPSNLGNVGLVVKVKENPIILVVDALLGERRLVLKPLDYRVPVPPYVAGCTVLGNRQIVPVLSPDYFVSLIKKLTPTQSQKINPEYLKLESINLQNIEQIKQNNGAIKYDRPGRILIIDDSRTVRVLLQQILSQAGFLVEEASDGAAGFAKVAEAQGQFDLVISDLEMPHLDGLGFLRKIRASQWSDLPVGMLTSQAKEIYVKTAQELGVKFYLTKPFKPADFLNLIVKTASKKY
jgi:chemotaxis protein histidine kinase CheA/ActR/RegA family two-component response regulator